jgi:hypothetical protein
VGALIKIDEYCQHHRSKKAERELRKALGSDYHDYIEEEIYGEFYDCLGQEYYDRIQDNENISEQEWLDIWGIHNAEEFLKCWRGNSDEVYEEWRKENGYG